jgi:hypothetical protein
MSVADNLSPGDEPDLARDTLRGAAEIAEFLYGDRKYRRRVYHLLATTNFPWFDFGSQKCAKRSSIRRWIADQEWKNTSRPRRGPRNK